MNWQPARLGLVAGCLQRAGIGSVRAPQGPPTTSSAGASANSSISDSRGQLAPTRSALTPVPPRVPNPQPARVEKYQRSKPRSSAAGSYQTVPLIQTQNHVSESGIRLPNPVKPVDLVVAGGGFDRLISRWRQRVGPLSAVGVRGSLALRRCDPCPMKITFSMLL
jgi:hypothetical protein